MFCRNGGLEPVLSAHVKGVHTKYLPCLTRFLGKYFNSNIPHPVGDCDYSVRLFTYIILRSEAQTFNTGEGKTCFGLGDLKLCICYLKLLLSPQSAL